MHLTIVDLDRNVRFGSAYNPGNDLISAMRLLALHEATHTGRIEFQVDEAFLTALIDQDKAEAKDTSSPRQVVETDNPRRAFLDNIPVVVMDEG